MIIKTLKRTECPQYMKEWAENAPHLPKIDEEYKKLREDIWEFDNKVRQDCDEIGEVKKDYYIDVHMGLLLYDYLWKIDGFNLRVAADDDFWRFLSLKVAPNVVARRWGLDNESHYWTRATRIWFRCIWWYIHLSWQGDMDKTERVLNSSCFTTDSVLNLVERTGRKGTYISVYRMIMYFYSTISMENLSEYKKGTKSQEDDLFRVVMRLNTAKSMVIEPALYDGGEEGYVRSLYKDAGVTV